MYVGKGISPRLVSMLTYFVTGWAQEPDDRPTFREIKQKLDGMFEQGSSITEEVEKTLTIERGMSLDPNGMAQESSRLPPSVCLSYHNHRATVRIDSTAPRPVSEAGGFRQAAGTAAQGAS